MCFKHYLIPLRKLIKFFFFFSPPSSLAKAAWGGEKEKSQELDRSLTPDSRLNFVSMSKHHLRRESLFCFMSNKWEFFFLAQTQELSYEMQGKEYEYESAVESLGS